MGDIKDDIKRAIKQGTTRTSLEDIQKQGYSHVKVVDQNRISELIFQAVESVLSERNANLLDEQREALGEDARQQFQKLLKEHQKAQERAKQMDAAKAKLDEEMQRMQALVTAEFGTDGDAGDFAKQTLDQQIRRMTDRQKMLLDKYAKLDETKRAREAEVVDLKIKVDDLQQVIAKMKGRGEAQPSMLIDEINALKDQRDDLKRLIALLKVMCHHAAITDYAAKNSLPEPAMPAKGHGVGILIGDRKTPRTGIKVRYEPGNPRPIIEFPKGKGPAPYTPKDGATTGNGNGNGNGAASADGDGHMPTDDLD